MRFFLILIQVFTFFTASADERDTSADNKKAGDKPKCDLIIGVKRPVVEGTSYQPRYGTLYGGSQVASSPKSAPLVTSAPSYDYLKEKEELREKLRNALKGRVSNEFKDQFELFRLKKMIASPYSRKVVVLVLGSPYEKISESRIQRAKYLAQFAIDRGYNVIFDADTTLAPYIAQVVAENGYGISSGEVPVVGFTNFLVIKNPYLRLKAFSAGFGTKVIVETTSTTGLSLIVNKDATHFVSDNKKSDNEKLSFEHWEPSILDGNFGLRFKTLDWFSIGTEKLSPFSYLSDEQVIQALDSFDIKKIFKHDEYFKSGFQQVKAEARLNGAGAVIFGSGSHPVGYSALVYDSARRLAEMGIAITTGGAAGVMEIANQAAFDAGAASVGIGLGGKLVTEKKSSKEVQTLTIEVDDYEQRIPLLLHGKEIVVFAPGGAGTLKELATSFMQEGLTTPHRLVIFLGEKYYGKMFADLMQLLPATISKNYFLANSADEVQSIVDTYRSEVWSKKENAKISSFSRPKPRTDRKSYTYVPVVKPEKSSDKDTDWDSEWERWGY